MELREHLVVGQLVEPVARVDHPRNQVVAGVFLARGYKGVEHVVHRPDRHVELEQQLGRDRRSGAGSGESRGEFEQQRLIFFRKVEQSAHDAGRQNPADDLREIELAEPLAFVEHLVDDIVDEAFDLGDRTAVKRLEHQHADAGQVAPVEPVDQQPGVEPHRLQPLLQLGRHATEQLLNPRRRQPPVGERGADVVVARDDPAALFGAVEDRRFVLQPDQRRPRIGEKGRVGETNVLDRIDNPRGTLSAHVGLSPSVTHMTSITSVLRRLIISSHSL